MSHRNTHQITIAKMSKSWCEKEEFSNAQTKRSHWSHFCAFKIGFASDNKVRTYQQKHCCVFKYWDCNRMSSKTYWVPYHSNFSVCFVWFTWKLIPKTCEKRLVISATTFFTLLLFGHSNVPTVSFLFERKMFIRQPFVESQSIFSISQIIVTMAYHIIAFRILNYWTSIGWFADRVRVIPG